MKILVTGARGLLGSALGREAAARGYPAFLLGRTELDVTDPTRCAEVLDRTSPTTVLHCAAYTAVDRAEAEPERTREVNELGTRNIVVAAERVGASVLYPSTDYVFGDAGRDRPWKPDDPTRPEGVYATTKLAGERAVLEASDRHLVARTGWLYGEGGKNFVDTILRVARERGRVQVVDDQRGRPTWARSLAATLFDLMERRATGVWHATDGGTATWFDLASAAVQLTGTRAEVDPVTTEAFGAAAPRPAYSVLDLERTEAFIERSVPHWLTSLGSYVGGGRADDTRSERTNRRVAMMKESDR